MRQSKVEFFKTGLCVVIVYQNIVAIYFEQLMFNGQSE